MSGISDSLSENIAAPPDLVWRLVADVPRMTEWSNQVERCDWVDGSTGPAVGARFKGDNRRGRMKWSRVCVVTESEPGRIFAFATTTPAGEHQTRWRYEFAAADGGTVVTESFEALRPPLLVRVLEKLAGTRTKAERRENLRNTLARLKQAAESS